jgi:hypothetical protein
MKKLFYANLDQFSEKNFLCVRSQVIALPSNLHHHHREHRCNRNCRDKSL